ncbi:uncharacterized protein LOC129753896 [Uranotaenia lowii]|uniref:uncharacterized protein LOC129753896 n=1 Tax=Uranotaenia lowii TaxID=190385 RepID=UPI0024798039|nr:uncharacterized protein LOC129753896 [Uranotaenia lowii]
MSSNGILLAIAIPLEVPGRNIYLSHNFEMNYGLPTNVTQFRLWYTLFKDTRYNIPEAIRRKRRMVDQSRFSRSFFYRLLAERMDMYGYNGTACIHKSICEAPEMRLHEHNGVLGDIMHVAFTPSASEVESLPSSYREAEINGMRSDCTKYQQHCPLGLFDLISQVI